MQTQINFTAISLHAENNRHSERILEDNCFRLSNNCKKLYDALKRGERLTGAIVVGKYGMLEYRRRIADLRAAGVQIQETILKGGLKEWYL